MIKVKRIYEKPEDDDGERYLVDGMWPRGVKKETAHLSGWLKFLAPSPVLRKWFNHDPERWADFQEHYASELQRLETQAILQDLAKKGRQGNVTLLYAARDTEHNNALVLKKFIERYIAMV
jgi:uncharacterized protein YeaO (DUF488 family)